MDATYALLQLMGYQLSVEAKQEGDQTYHIILRGFPAHLRIPPRQKKFHIRIHLKIVEL